MKKLLLLFILLASLTWAQTPSSINNPILPNGSNVFPRLLSGTFYVNDQNSGGWAGADVCAQENSVEAVAPNGSIIDMRGLSANTVYACSGTWTACNSNSYMILLPGNVINPNGTPGMIVKNSCFFVGVNPVGSVGGSSRLNVSGSGKDVIQWQASYGGMQDIDVNANNAAALHLLATSTVDVRGNVFRNIRATCNGSATGSIGFEFTGFDTNHIATENSAFNLESQECATDIQFDTGSTQGPTEDYIFGLKGASTSGAGVASINVLKGDSLFVSGAHLNNKAIGIQVCASCNHNQFDAFRGESNTVDIADAGVCTTFLGASLSANSSTFTGTCTTILGRSNGSYVLQQKIGGFNVPQAVALTSQYTNSTTSFTNVAGGNTLAFTAAANTSYTGTCHLYYQAAVTGGLNIEFTGPASPTSVSYALNEPIALGTANNTVATAYGTSLGNVVTTAATNFDSTVTFSLINGVNAGTVNLLAKSSAAVQLQIQTNSFCNFQ